MLTFNEYMLEREKLDEAIDMDSLKKMGRSALGVVAMGVASMLSPFGNSGDTAPANPAQAVQPQDQSTQSPNPFYNNRMDYLQKQTNVDPNDAEAYLDNKIAFQQKEIETLSNSSRSNFIKRQKLAQAQQQLQRTEQLKKLYKQGKIDYTSQKNPDGSFKMSFSTKR